MYIVDRSLRFIRGALLSYGPSFLKKSFWDQEYSTSKWNFNDNTTNDFVYPYLEKWARKGSILDLGCGSGNTSNELADSAYTSYLGVDISDVALAKARKWTEQSGRMGKNKFVQGELLSYVPPQRFDVILFRESMYHVPLGKVKAILEHYANYLTPEGVIIVRMSKTQDGKPKWRPTAMFRAIEREFDVVEQGECVVGFGGTVMVFRPRATPQARTDSSTAVN
jgi:2-polyprenyl-3-methyl-5-hydroxy-6-metoxy-1,4-benzoquinol methylase